MKKALYSALLIAFTLPFSGIAQEEIQLKGKQLFGDMKARHIGPALMSGRINDLEVHPTNSRIMYAGTAGGGVWKSSDGGATYAPIFDEHVQSIGVVSLDPTNPDQNIWVGTGETWTRNSVSIGDGLFKSTDGGNNFKEVPSFENSERITSIEINPKNNKEIYVGVLGELWGDNEDRGVYKTTDGGETWKKILYVGPSTGASDVIMDPNNPNVLYASMWQFRRSGWGFSSGGLNSGLYKSTNSGATWAKIQTGFPAGKLGRIAIAVAPSDSTILYSVLETEDPKKNGLWKSTNAGASWEHLNNDFGLVVRPFYFSRIVIDPKNPDIVLKGGLNGSISRDGGKTFKSLGNMHSDIHDLAFHINDSDVIYSGTDGGVYRSWNGGTTFEIVENLPISQFYHISVDNAEPYNVYGGLQDNGSWYGPSSSPGGVNARDWNSVGYGDGFRVLKHPTKNIVYSEMQGAENVWRYDVDRNRTKTIQPLPKKGDAELRFNWNAPMAVSEHQPDRFYMGSQFLHVSEDMGDTWKIISPDLTTNDKSKQDQSKSGGLSVDNSGAENHTTIFTIAESPLDEKIIWVGTDDGNVQVTKNGGKSWDNVTKNLTGIPANTWVYHIEASVHGKGTAYAVFEGHTSGDMKPYAMKTTDYGKTWKSIITPDIQENAFVRNIQEDYVNEDLLFLGTEMGLYVTINGGKNWSHFTNNMPPVAVHFIEMQKQTNDIVMGTHGRGVIIIDDISPLRELNQQVLAEDVHFFDSKPFIMVEDSGFAGSFGAETQFVGQNKSTAGRIVYYLKKRHTFGKMTLEVQDMDGNVMTKLDAGKSKGINVVNWSFNTQNPKMAAAKTLSFGGFTSPRVPEGQYKVVLKKGKNTYEKVIETKYDATSITTLAERKEQEALTQELFVMVEDLAYMVYEIGQMQTKAKEVIDANGAGKADAQKLWDALENLRTDLVITTGDNYVASAEPELRERMGELYSNVATSYDRVSGALKQNYELIKDDFSKEKVRFEKIKDKEGKKFMKVLEKNNLGAIEMKTKTEFLTKD
ncbi:WD40/YVTN/BNR-like repeat-containing protein [Patiriisocius marinus]|uniref:WD40/YVTN/BNR-like repeat-containing protein n=1 Tax=Patiriisocius marinus TaxID=1397112 RepID=UPI00232D4ABB|nr:sialidase family protein [Patiriisocius marinus]